MANLKYPAGLKVKSSLGWIGAFVAGFCPMLYFFPTYLVKEHYTGNAGRNTGGEEKLYHVWMLTGFRHSVQMGELLRKHPQYEYKALDRKRLGLETGMKIQSL